VKNPFYIFRIKREERWLALASLLYIILWNVLVINKYADIFFPFSRNYRNLFLKFHISGFDPLSYVVISRWFTEYNIYRHPLLAFFMYIPNQIDQGLMALTGMNWATVIMAVILTFCAFYSFIFLFRILREVIGLTLTDSRLLTLLFGSFAYVMVVMSVPDHFCLSMFMLILTLYVAGKKMKANHPYTIWQTVLFFIVTAGISLNNGIKVFLANLFTNGKRFWRPANLLLAIILPSALIWGFARWEWNHYQAPHQIAVKKFKKRAAEKKRAKLFMQVRDTMTEVNGKADSLKALAYVDTIMAKERRAKKLRDSKKAVFAHAGKPMGKGEFEQWTDISTPRGWSFVENIFGEPIQLHQDYLLGDVLVKRPVIVHYRWAWNYIAEGLILLLFLAGIWCGHRSRFMWLAMSFFGFDMVIHFALGFGLNEVYIMSPHWLMVLPIVMAYLFFHKPWRWLRYGTTVLALYLLIYNSWLYISYLI
jgi:hypothetical protein